jgi:hypothetical protein
MNPYRPQNPQNLLEFIQIYQNFILLGTFLSLRRNLIRH